MTVMSAPGCANAIRLVSRWGAWYTRGLPAEVAGARRDELASDLWEHASWAHESGEPANRLARSILWRAAAGAVSDLGWRWRQIDGLPPREAREHRFNATALSGALALALALLAWSAFVFTRIGRGISEGWASLESESSIAMLVFTFLALVGLPLLLTRRTRFFGAVWLTIPAVGLLLAGAQSLIFGSATIAALFYLMPGWHTALLGVASGVALLFVAAGLRWLPIPTRKVAR
jgi:hypothetical protein